MNPLSEGSSENWYSNETEIEMAVNDLFRHAFWPIYIDEWTDDFTRRELTTPITNATINGEWGTVSSIWSNSYKAISRANTILMNLDEVEGIPESVIGKFKGNAHFVRAAQYAKLIFLYGDVIFTKEVIDIEQAFTMSRTSKNQILEEVYNDYDLAASLLPVSYGSSENKLATKGAAFAMKARIALAMGDYAIARDAAKACIDLETYELYPDFGELFLTRTKNPKNSFLDYLAPENSVWFGVFEIICPEMQVVGAELKLLPGNCFQPFYAPMAFLLMNHHYTIRGNLLKTETHVVLKQLLNFKHLTSDLYISLILIQQKF
jgi:hypothetical protein